MSTRTTRAYVLTGPGEGEVQEVAAPVAALGEVVVDVERVCGCGTDVEFFTGEMAYLHQGYASYPMRLGHEWAGTVASVGNGVDPAWAGRRVMGDTMLGDGVCRRCRKGHQHVCENRYELGVRGTVPAPWPSRWPYRPPRYTSKGRSGRRPLVVATVGLEQVGAVLAGERPEAASARPKIPVDPQLT